MAADLPGPDQGSVTGPTGTFSGFAGKRKMVPARRHVYVFASEYAHTCTVATTVALAPFDPEIDFAGEMNDWTLPGESPITPASSPTADLKRALFLPLNRSPPPGPDASACFFVPSPAAAGFPSASFACFWEAALPLRLSSGVLAPCPLTCMPRSFSSASA